MNKRLLLLITLLLIIPLLVAACGDDDADTDENLEDAIEENVEEETDSDSILNPADELEAAMTSGFEEGDWTAAEALICDAAITAAQNSGLPQGSVVVQCIEGPSTTSCSATSLVDTDAGLFSMTLLEIDGELCIVQ